MSVLEAYALRVDGQAHPQGVISAPSFSWRLRGDRRGARQSGYRIVVRVRIGEDDVVTWDSGPVSSPDTVGVVYAGAPLHTSADYRWTLSVEDERGGVFETGASFATGVVHAAEWDAAWIGRSRVYRQVALPPQDTDITYTVNKLQPVRRFVHHFDLDELPVAAKVHASAKGVYRLYVNGVRVGQDELVPGWTEYRERVTYQSHDVTSLLRKGVNSIAALVGDGWYVGFIGTDRRHQAQHYGKEPAFLAQLTLDRADGGRRIVATDQRWRESASDILYADLLMGQYEDSRLANPTWHLPEQNLETWSTVEVTSTDTSLLVPEADPAVRATESLAPRTITPRGDGRHVVDFGQNLVGRVRLTLRDLPAGRRIQLSHAEVLDDDGEIYTANLRTAEPIDVFWTDGSPTQVFEPRFTLHGFRYAEIRGIDGVVQHDDLSAVVLHNDFERLGTFASSSADLDALLSNITWSLRGNFVSIPTDCPQRDERLGWLADAQVFAPTALRIADVGPLLRRWMRDVRSAQTADGAFPDIAPHLIHLREGAPAWGDGGVTIPWHVYQATGDTSVLAEAADSMIAWVRHIERHNPDLVWRTQVGNDYGDWLQLGEETRKDVLATAYFAYSTDLTARALRVVGRGADAAPIEGLLARIRATFQQLFIADDGTVAGDTQGGYLLALAFDLCAPEQRDAVASRLVASVERRDSTLTTGFITVGLLCPVLTAIGREDLAFALLHNDRYPSWLFSVRNGATTIWERWDGWTPDGGFQSPRMNSFNHYSLGAVGEWYFSGILGITQSGDAGGFRSLVLAPRFDPQLDWARGALETPRGRVESAWERVADGVRWSLTVPPGGPAEVDLPSREVSEITEGGESAPSSEAITREVASQSTRLIVEPGSYHFLIPAR